MNAIWQVLLALLAAVGLLALGWLTFGRLLTPVGGGGGGPVYAVAAALLARGQGIVLCPAERLGEYIKA